MASKKQAPQQAIERFDVIGNAAESRCATDRIMCRGCRALVKVADRVLACVDANGGEIYTCAACAESKTAPEFLAPLVGPAIKPYRLEGSYQNRLYENMIGMPDPVPGMGATCIMYSDRRAYTVVEVKSPSVIVVQQDTAQIVEGGIFSEHQVYTFSANAQAVREVLRRNKYGQWKRQGGSTKFLVGRRMEYRDPSF